MVFRLRLPTFSAYGVTGAVYTKGDWAEAVIGAVRSQLSGAPSGEPVTATVHVDRNGDGAWAVRGEDLQAVNSAMLLYP